MTKKDRRRPWAASVLMAAAGIISSCASSYDVNRVDTFVGAEALAASSRPAAAATAPAVDLPAVPPTGPIRLNVQQALILALNHNKALLVDKYNPPIRRTFEQQELAQFDPVLFGNLAAGRNRMPYQGVVPNDEVNTNSASGQVGLTEFLPTGTRLVASATGSFEHDPVNGEQNVSRIGLTATQSLLRGYGLDVNLASLHQVQVDTRSSKYELRGLAQSIVAQTEEAYWDYVLALRQIALVRESLDLAQKQLDDVSQRIGAGRLADLDRAAAEAEVATRREDLIDANSAAEQNRLKLLRLLSPPGAGPLNREVLVEQQPVVQDTPVDPVEQHLELAQRIRPELNQARLLVNRNELEIVKTRNGLLPRLDLFVTLGKSGYADSFGRSVGDAFTRDPYDVQVGVSGEYPLGNRGPRAQYDRSVLGRDQSIQSLENLSQLVEQDVRSSYIELLRARQQIVATAATRKLQEEKLRAEELKFRADKSTSLQVAQAQRDLLASRIAEVQAVVSFLKAHVELYRLDGSLLVRRGIAAPGREAVKLTTRQ